MPGPISGRRIVEAMIQSGEKAVVDFRRISGGEWFDEAPEYFLTTYVALAVKQIESAYVLLEPSVGQTRKFAGSVRRGRASKHERRCGRFDVVLYWANGSPRAAIEVKSPVYSVTEQQIHPDIDRICSSLSVDNGSTFQFGAFLFYASAGEPERRHGNACERLCDLLERLEKSAIERAIGREAEAKLLQGGMHGGREGDGGAWCIASVVITPFGGMRSF